MRTHAIYLKRISSWFDLPLAESLVVLSNSMVPKHFGIPTSSLKHKIELLITLIEKPDCTTEELYQFDV